MKPYRHLSPEELEKIIKEALSRDTKDLLSGDPKFAPGEGVTEQDDDDILD